MKTRIVLAAACLALLPASAVAADREILLIGSRPSHPPREHEHNADIWLMEKWLSKVKGVHVTTSFERWPENAALVEKADAILMDCDGGDNHPVFKEGHVEALQKAAARGAGIMFYHYCVEPPGKSGHEEMLNWIGGYFEINYSVNPIWEGDFKTLPRHPITRGVAPFKIRDEWYYNMRFREGMKGVTPILTAVPPPETLSRPDGEHSGNPDVRAKAGQPQHVLWAYERPGGGRGVGLTGGHYHLNLGNDSFRKLVLNSILWIAKADVPPNGVASSVTDDELLEHLDPKPGRGGAPKK